MLLRSSKRAYPVYAFEGRLAAPPGTILSVPWERPYHWWPVRHVGIAGDRLIDGHQSVIHCPRRPYGRVIEVSLTDFAPDGVFGVLGFPGQLAPSQVVDRARAHLNRPYHVTRFNCEHLISEAHGVGGSPQLRRGIGAGLAFLGVAGGSVLLARYLKKQKKTSRNHPALD